MLGKALCSVVAKRMGGQGKRNDKSSIYFPLTPCSLELTFTWAMHSQSPFGVEMPAFSQGFCLNSAKNAKYLHYVSTSIFFPQFTSLCVLGMIEWGKGEAIVGEGLRHWDQVASL